MSDRVRPLRRWLREMIILGGASSVLALALAAIEPRALGGWLAAYAFWTSLPIGALCLVMMMRLIPGAWREELAPAGESALLLLPLALIAALPIFAGLPALYDWVGGVSGGGFRGHYLTPWFFVARTLLFYAVSGTLAFLLVRRRDWSTPVASAGLIVFVLIDTTVVIDWLMSLDPEFHSSGFGLYVLSIQTTVALAALILVRLLRAEPSESTVVLGSLLLTALLLWAYFAFMQYLISWSGNFPSNVLWYQRRAGGVWSLAEYAIGALALAPAFLLLFSPVRRGPGWLIALSVAVLSGKALEMAWLVLPTVSAALALTLVVTMLAFAGLGLLSVAAFVWAMHALASLLAERAEGGASP
ncbi:MAG: hypothetical protein KJZ80_15755 [Hyphomicrobiaceae bacterium]|nr:hypothetical protein [Hyphomicrobiaceae bacterium]